MDCPLVQDPAFRDLIELHLLPLGQAGGSAGTWLRHVAVQPQRHSTTFGAELLLENGTIASTFYTEPAKFEAKKAMRKGLDDVGSEYIGDDAATRVRWLAGCLAGETLNLKQHHTCC